MAREKKSKKEIKNLRKIKREKEVNEFRDLERRIAEYDPNIHEKEISQFSDLPLTQPTLKGLKEASFVAMTEIQRKTIPMALKGEDVMGTAKTGSGKTLAFLIPMIEKLIRNDITEYDGLTAIIVSPIRELAVQIFEVLTKIGKYNTFSAGLVTGGKDLQFEKQRISRMNILVGTPGRIAQHLNEGVGLETSNLQVLILDEADRCLDMGFKKQIDTIVGHLPPTRQTLLFSATLTESVKDLARLSLTNPRKIGNDSEDASSTPESLDQYYVRIPLDEKLDVLWSFIKSHLKSKILVFFSSLKQVQYAYETFATLQPGVPLMKLYGRHKQASRLETTYKFSKAQHACLLATDIVARGLDFPAIDWVVQVDCPEDAATYIHRVGRAARLGRQGRSLLILLPSEEEAMIKRLESKHINLKLMNIKQKSKKSIRPQLQSLCFKDNEIKYLGQKAFISYIRSVYLQKDKEVFKFDELPKTEYAYSLGLPGAPNIKIKDGSLNREKKNIPRALLNLAKPEEKDNEDKGDEKAKTRLTRLFERKNQTTLSDHYLKLVNNAQDNSDDEDFMSVKNKDHDIDDNSVPILSVPVSKRQQRKALSKKASLGNKGNSTKLLFDDEGNRHPIYEFEDEEDFKKKGDPAAQKQEFVQREQDLMRAADADDKMTVREKRQEKKRIRKEMEARMNEEFSSEEEMEPIVTVGDPDLDKDMEENEDNASSEAEEYKRPAKKLKLEKKDIIDYKNNDKNTVEFDEPETIEDLEALTSKLIEH